MAYHGRNLKWLFIRGNAVIIKTDWKQALDWTDEFYSWLKINSRSYALVEKEVSQILGYKWRFLADKEFKNLDVNLHDYWMTFELKWSNYLLDICVNHSWKTTKKLRKILLIFWNGKLAVFLIVNIFYYLLIYTLEKENLTLTCGKYDMFSIPSLFPLFKYQISLFLPCSVLLNCVKENYLCILKKIICKSRLVKTYRRLIITICLWLLLSSNHYCADVRIT